jgi:hypothetical protein
MSAQMWRRIRDTVGVAALTADALKNMAQEADRLIIVDSSTVRVVEVPQAGAHTPAAPQYVVDTHWLRLSVDSTMIDGLISSEYMHSMEQEAAAWKARWSDIQQDTVAQAPSSLVRANSMGGVAPADSTSPHLHSRLTRAASAPNVMTGLNKTAWSQLMCQLTALKSK